MSEQPRVVFPSEMTVKAPATDNLIFSLTKAFENLSHMMQKGVTEVTDSLQTLKHLPELVQNLEKSVGAQFSSLFIHLVEGQVVGRKSRILAVQANVDTCKRRIDDKGTRLKEDSERVKERYQTLLKGVADDTAGRVKQLDSHALDLLQRAYPKQVQEAFSFESIPMIDFLAAQADEAAESRTVTMELAGVKSRLAARKFLDRRAAFYREFDQRCLHEGIAEGGYELPFTVIELEDVTTGQVERHIAFDFEDHPHALPPARLAQLREAAAAKIARCEVATVPPPAQARLRGALAAHASTDRQRTDDVLAHARWLSEPAAP